MFTWVLGRWVASTVIIIITQTFRRALTASVDRVPLEHVKFGRRCREAILGVYTCLPLAGQGRLRTLGWR